MPHQQHFEPFEFSCTHQLTNDVNTNLVGDSQQVHISTMTARNFSSPRSLESIDFYRFDLERMMSDCTLIHLHSRMIAIDFDGGSFTADVLNISRTLECVYRSRLKGIL